MKLLHPSGSGNGTPQRTEGPNKKGVRASTGVSGLDDILGGGLPCDRQYLIQGNPGTGKTTLALQFLRRGKELGEPVLYITLAESADELRSTIESHGWERDSVDIYEHLPSAKQVADSHHTLFHPDEVDLNETVSALIEVIERVRPRRLVLDSLSELQLLADSVLRYRREVLALKEYFADRKCTTLLLDDRTTGGDDTQLQSLCHGVLMLEGVTPDYGPEKRRLRVTKLRGLRFREGWHDYRIETGGLIVYPRLVASEYGDISVPELLKSDLSPLDDMLGGGIDRGTATLLMGPSGTGKSSVATRFAIAAASRGEKVAMYIFDERPTTLFIRSAGLGLDIEPHIDSGNAIVQSIDAAEMTPGEFTHNVRKRIDEDNVKLVIIDSLAGYLHAMPGAHALILHLRELLTFLGQKGVTTLMVVTQHGMLGAAIQGDIDVSYLADNVLLLRYYEFAGEVRKALSVFKRRGGSHERAIRELVLGPPEGVILGEPLVNYRGVMTGVPIFAKVHEADVAASITSEA